MPEQKDTPWSPVEIGLVVLGILLILAAAAAGTWWWRKRKKRGVKAASAPKPMERNRMLNIRNRFLAMQPWRKQAAISDLPTVVVLGPAGSGKTRLIELDVDWQRQASQFMPSCMDDPLLQIYLGPETVVHEVSAPLLEDGSKHALRALSRLWKATFSRRQALVVVAIDAHWLTNTPADEVRRVAHLLRGKINLVSEACQAPVETRLCMTHMDELEGFLDFARELRTYREPLHFELPKPGEEQQLDATIRSLEKYLASGLTSLPLEAFERMAAFYSRIHSPLAALTRFITALREGGRLSLPLNLTRAYFSSSTPEARALGTFDLKAEVAPARLQASYQRKHLVRCAVLLAVGCLPVLAAYTHFRNLLHNAQHQISKFDDTVKRLQRSGLSVEGPVLEQRGRDAMAAMEDLWRATAYWPPLRSSFTGDLATLRRDMSDILRDYYLRPLIKQCQQQCTQCASQVPGCQPPSTASAMADYRDQGVEKAVCKTKQLCRPEHMLYLLALVHSSRDDDLGRFMLGSLQSDHAQRWAWATSLGLNLSDVGARGKEESWVETLGLAQPVVGDYVVASDIPWSASAAGATEQWTRWPFQWLTVESHLTPWQGHFRRLRDLVDKEDLHPEEWEELQKERQYLQNLLTESRSYASSKLVLDLLNASETGVNEKTLSGVRNTLQALEWLRDNQSRLEAVLRMEQEAYQGIEAVKKMSWAEVLTLSNGLFTPRDGDERLRIDVLGEPFEFIPQKVSRQLLSKVIHAQERAPGGFFGVSEATARRQSSPEALLAERNRFTSEIKPLVDNFGTLLKDRRLSLEQEAERKQYVLAKMDEFARNYRERLSDTITRHRFEAQSRKELRAKLEELSQPASGLVDMLHSVTTSAALGTLEGEYYASLRNALAPFQSLISLLKEDKEGDGQYDKLTPYLLLVSQFHTELTKGTPPGISPVAGSEGATPNAPAEQPQGAKAISASRLPELLSPLGRAALPMLLEDKESYLSKVDAWLNEQGILGEFREPFRRPFLVAMELGQEELETVLATQWEQEWAHTLRPLLERYPFTSEATLEVEPSELEVLHRKNGSFWSFVERVVAPLCTVQGTSWSLRGPLQNRLRVPPQMLETLSHLSELSSLLWSTEGKPQALSLQVLPQPLPPSPVSDSFVTMSYLKCGKTTAFSFNQNPTWQDFPLSWWDPQPASIGLEFRSPVTEERDYRAQEISRSFWSCFRLLEAASAKDGRQWTWTLLRGKGSSRQRGVEIRFGVRGEPWVPFRRLSL
jgi:type VI secretion system protein ImpL